MKGLEISEIRLSEVLNDNDDFRIHSEYFKKRFNNITSNSIKLSDIAIIADGDHSKFPSNQKQEYRYFQAKDIKDNFLCIPANGVFVSKEYFMQNKRSHILEESVLISIMGNIGDIAITPKGFKPALCNRAIAIIKYIKVLNPYYVFAYLITNDAFENIERIKNGGVQQRINLDVLGKIKVPILPQSFQLQIEQMVKYAHAKLEESKQLYTEAENMLLEELGLKNWQPKNENINVKTLSESFLSSGRLDAEYYQSKYDEVKQKITNFKSIKLKDLVKYPVSSGSTPRAGASDYYTDADNGIPFIRAVDIINSQVQTDNFIYIKSNVHNGILKRTRLKKGDVLFSIAGTVGRCGIFDYDFEANINQALAILRFDETIIKHLYLIFFFNSYIGQLIIEQYSRQGVQTNLNLDELSNLEIPILPMLIQNEISAKIQRSFALKKESKSLLEQAKTMVENEIEKGE